MVYLVRYGHTSLVSRGLEFKSCVSFLVSRGLEFKSCVFGIVV
jgi:hypothetical protein